jgi:hypothetical protein
MDLEKLLELSKSLGHEHALLKRTFRPIVEMIGSNWEVKSDEEIHLIQVEPCLALGLSGA